MTTINRYRSRKDKNGNVSHYPLIGMSKKAAKEVATRLMEEYPDERVRVLPLTKSKSKSNRYAPFISYLFDNVKSWLPLTGKINISNYIPKVTSSMLSYISGGVPFYVYLDSMHNSTYIMGSSSSGNIKYFMDWDDTYHGDKSKFLMVDGDNIKKPKNDFQFDAARIRIDDELDEIKNVQKTYADLTDTQVLQLADTLKQKSFSDSTVFGDFIHSI